MSNVRYTGLVVGGPLAGQMVVKETPIFKFSTPKQASLLDYSAPADAPVSGDYFQYKYLQGVVVDGEVPAVNYWVPSGVSIGTTMKALHASYADKYAAFSTTVTETEAKVKYMVERFLRWRLPADFYPDGGVSFEQIANKGTLHQYTREPTGTNLLSYTQAEAMVRYMLGMTDPS